MANQVLVQDPWEAAANPPAPVSEWYGQVTINPWFCSLVKGIGRVPFDPNQLDPNTGQALRRNTAIDLALAPITEKPMEPLTRTAIAEFGEWPDIILPSMRDLGITNLQALNHAWVRMEMTPTGRTYNNKDGEKRDATTFRFTALYPDEAACRAAYQAARGSASTPAPAAATPSNGGNKEYDTALKFLRPYIDNAWAKSGGDLLKAQDLIAPLLAAQPLLSKYFTAGSPEVLNMFVEKASK